MIQSLFVTLSSLTSLFSLVCLVRILFTWIPNLEYSPVGKFLGVLCDPFLNWFRRFSFTRIGVMDFSPILALATLSAATMILSSIAATGRVSPTIIAFIILQVIWSFISFLLNILVLFLLIRLIYDLANRYKASPFWTMLDRFLNPVISFFSRSVTSLLGMTRPLRYRVSLLITFISILALRIGLGIGMGYLYVLLMSQPG